MNLGRMNLIGIAAMLLVAGMLTIAISGCNTPPPPPESAERTPPPNDFFQPASFTNPRPEHTMLLPEYRINFGDQLEIIYQIRHSITEHAYRLQIEDRLNIRFPFQPQLNQSVVVLSDGMIRLLLLNDPVRAAGMTIEELTDLLRTEYGKQVQNPQLTVQVEQANVKVEELKRMITTSPRGQSRLVPVKPDGRITLPFIKDIMAFGRTTVELTDALNQAYREANLEAVEVSANILVVKPLRVYVFGEVFRPGLIEVDYRTTMTQAIATAGGWVRGRAAADKVLLVRRRGMPVPTGAVLNVDYMTQGIGTQATKEQEVDFASHRFDPFLKDEDIIYVPSNQLAKNADWIDIVFTKGIYRVIPWSSSYSVSDNVDWLRPNE